MAYASAFTGDYRVSRREVKRIFSDIFNLRVVIYYAILTDFFYNKQNKKDYRPSWLCFFAPELPVRAFEPVQRTAKKSS